MFGTRPYRIYNGLKNRCKNKKNPDFPLYGGRGIKCEWENFIDFWKDMEIGYKDNLTIDRIDPDGNYKKSNCRWVTNDIQQSNKRNNVFETYKGETKHLSYWVKISGLKKSTFHQRRNRGWTIQQIIENKTLKSTDKKLYNGKKVA